MRTFNANYSSVAAKAVVFIAMSAVALTGCSKESAKSNEAAGGTSTASTTSGGKAGTWEDDSATWSKNLPGSVNGFTKDSEDKQDASIDATYSDTHNVKVHFVLCKSATEAACSGATQKKEWKGYTVAVTSSDDALLAQSAADFLTAIIPA